ncbi:uncharacterized protein MONBRDRAFT_36036 [Monosiga brevicollis MX1]|uniref:Uncharacterized protein n=1 Tax=Monosiga brevicollis TaxID=81824 RepID=A9URH1_MONBE|nr:uncharacterized protein MONBRDRAFT_36036 [Monosiga brevicollis MX1]EDQ91922.1 predicted protein [Monosiga brevicollis MX1]|eukprot:XP_001743208.1 hypothetical protein [Monosiga brevicollis MX1]
MASIPALAALSSAMRRTSSDATLSFLSTLNNRQNSSESLQELDVPVLRGPGSPFGSGASLDLSRTAGLLDSFSGLDDLDLSAFDSDTDSAFVAAASAQVPLAPTTTATSAPTPAPLSADNANSILKLFQSTLAEPGFDLEMMLEAKQVDGGILPPPATTLHEASTAASASGVTFTVGDPELDQLQPLEYSDWDSSSTGLSPSQPASPVEQTQSTQQHQSMYGAPVTSAMVTGNGSFYGLLETEGDHMMPPVLRSPMVSSAFLRDMEQAPLTSSASLARSDRMDASLERLLDFDSDFDLNSLIAPARSPVVTSTATAPSATAPAPGSLRPSQTTTTLCERAMARGSGQQPSKTHEDVVSTSAATTRPMLSSKGKIKTQKEKRFTMRELDQRNEHLRRHIDETKGAVSDALRVLNQLWASGKLPGL